MATQRQASIVAVAAAAVLGVGMYRMTGKSPETPIKREQPGIKGAGAGTGRGSSRTDQEPDASDGHSKANIASTASGTEPGVSGALRGVLSKDGSQSADDSRVSGIHNTRGISKMGSEVPSKKTSENSNTV